MSDEKGHGEVRVTYSPPLFHPPGPRVRQACVNALRRLVHRLLAFDCSLSGPGVWLDEGMHAGPWPEALSEMRVRVPSQSVMTAMHTVLAHCDFPLSWHPHPRRVGWYLLDVAELDPTGLTPPSTMALELTGTSRFVFLQQACDFDIDLPVRTRASLGLMGDSSRLVSHAGTLDPLGFLLDRVRSKRFALMRPNYNCDGRLCERVSRAEGLVNDGWTMDDANGTSSWLVTRWWVLTHRSDAIRLSQGAGCPFSRPMVRTEVSSSRPAVLGCHAPGGACALCREAFSAVDVVIRLSCGHTFHPSCASACERGADAEATGGGLMQWLTLGHTTCPLCRSTIAC